MSNEVQIAETLSTQQLQNMISQLSVTEEGEELKNAMDDLKKALRANPAACASLLPEDIGSMVKVLMQITGKEMEEDTADKRKGRTKKEKFDFSDPNVKQEIEDDLF